MRRVAPCLMLLLAPALAWAAAPGSYADPDRGTCIDAPQSAARGTSADADPASTPHAGSAHPHAATTQGGGNDGELVVPRTRMPRWHSFLPGMFR